jgi:hypothetical protein
MVGTLEDIQNQYKLKQRSRDTSNSKVNDEFISDMWSVMDRAGNLLISKHHDYGPLNIARSPGGPINGLRVRMWDKIARINHLVDNNSAPQNESLRDSFMDLLNYSAIAIMVLDGNWPEVQALDCE